MHRRTMNDPLVGARRTNPAEFDDEEIVERDVGAVHQETNNNKRLDNALKTDITQCAESNVVVNQTCT